MYYGEEVVEEVRESNDIVDLISEYVRIKKKGSNYSGLCPFHNEKTPSFMINPDKQLYYCFGCGAGGNIFTFLMQIENMEFGEAIKFLAKRSHIDLPEPKMSDEMKKKYKLKEKIYEIHKKAARFYYDNLKKKESYEAKKYLSRREINHQMQVKFGLGFAFDDWDDLVSLLKKEGFKEEEIIKSGLANKKNKKVYNRFRDRLMFPIFDIHNRVVGFGGRIIGEGNPKYLNSPETLIFNKRRHLYGLNLAKKVRPKNLILVEGYMDVIMMHQAGFVNSVASLGTAFTQDHAKLMKRFVDEVIIAFDNDNAGRKAILRAIPILKKQNLKIKILDLKDQKDPDDYLKKYGAKSLKEQINKAISYIDFKINILKKEYNLKNPDEKIEFVNKASEIIASIDNSIQKDVYLKKISKETNISKNAILNEINKRKNKNKKKVKNNYSNSKNEDNDKKINKNINKVQDSFIRLILIDKNIFNKAHEHIDENDLTGEFYKKIFDKIKDFYDYEEYINEAELLNIFSNKEEQIKLNEIISKNQDRDLTKVLIKKELEELIKNIKIYKIEEQQANANTDMKLSLALQKKKVSNLKINM